jgi:hypothetical protein
MRLAGDSRGSQKFSTLSRFRVLGTGLALLGSTEEKMKNDTTKKQEDGTVRMTVRRLRGGVRLRTDLRAGFVKKFDGGTMKAEVG